MNSIVLRLQNWLDCTINSSVLIAISVVCMTQLTYTDLQIPVYYNILFVVFFGTIVGYNFMKYAFMFWRKIFLIQDNKVVFSITLYAFFGALVCFIPLKSSLKWAFTFIGLLVIAYPFVRKLGKLKIFLVAFAITYITVFVPCLAQTHLPTGFYIIFIQRFFWVMALLIPFEILDLKYDALHMQTIPQRYGVAKTKIFGIITLVLFQILEFLKPNSNYYTLIVSALLLVLIIYASTNKSKYYTLLLVESLPILWWGFSIFKTSL